MIVKWLCDESRQATSHRKSQDYANDGCSKGEFTIVTYSGYSDVSREEISLSQLAATGQLRYAVEGRR